VVMGGIRMLVVMGGMTMISLAAAANATHTYILFRNSYSIRFLRIYPFRVAIQYINQSIRNNSERQPFLSGNPRNEKFNELLNMSSTTGNPFLNPLLSFRTNRVQFS